MKRNIKELIPGIILGTEPEIIENPFSGQSIECPADFVAAYDYMRGCELLNDYKGVRKVLDWAMEYYPEHYMVLMD